VEVCPGFELIAMENATALGHDVLEIGDKLLIHGARSVLRPLSRSATPLGAWLRGLLARAHVNTAVVALANKLARIAWAVLSRTRTFTAGAVMVA